MKSRIINEYGIVYIRAPDGFYVPEAEPEPKISGLWLMAMGIGTFAAVCFIGAYFIMEAIAGV
jgi:hypothetical protein